MPILLELLTGNSEFRLRIDLWSGPSPPPAPWGGFRWFPEPSWRSAVLTRSALPGRRRSGQTIVLAPNWGGSAAIGSTDFRHPRIRAGEAAFESPAPELYTAAVDKWRSASNYQASPARRSGADCSTESADVGAFPGWRRSPTGLVRFCVGAAHRGGDYPARSRFKTSSRRRISSSLRSTGQP